MTSFSRHLARRGLLFVLNLISFAALVACGGSSGSNGGGSASVASQPPNILFVIMDDVGIDQMSSFGYGGSTPPSMPNMNAVAKSGLRFRNAWSMPECSPGRAAMLVGRYPLRTNVYQAIGPNDLANSQISPYETTTPKLLKHANYESGLFGKFHLAGPENNASGNGTPANLGWDYFHGWVGGLPASIDTTAGGVAPAGTYACGFVPAASAGGADQGACRFASGACTDLSAAASGGDAPGKACLLRGGIFQPSTSCAQSTAAALDFNRENAYYVSPLVISQSSSVEVAALSDSRARGYRSTIETSAAIDWIRSRSAGRPWMATVAYSAAHTPTQPPPAALLKSGLQGADAYDCKNPSVQGTLQNQMIEAMDAEFGRLLVETGLARRAADGTLVYDPAAGNTMIVIVGDNGTLGATVKPPFDGQRAKGTSYQTGVWVPMIVAGPKVSKPDRDVQSMVNMVDVYSLFGEIAGLDAVALVPRRIDAQSVMPYLASDTQPDVRQYNFAQSGFNLQAGGTNNGPCVLGANPGLCSQIPTTKSVCEDNGGVWWGAGADNPAVPANMRATGYASCCAAKQAIYKQTGTLIGINPSGSTALRNLTHKLIRNTIQTYDVATDSCGEVTTTELYEVDQAVPTPKLDKNGTNLFSSSMSAALQQVYAELSGQLNALLASQPACVGDGNLDGVVDAVDVTNAQTVLATWGLSSVYDVNLDGRTNQQDVDIIRSKFGACPR